VALDEAFDQIIVALGPEPRLARGFGILPEQSGISDVFPRLQEGLMKHWSMLRKM
jgi:hypothetical protein